MLLVDRFNLCYSLLQELKLQLRYKLWNVVMPFDF
jgi:hypothetical protein